MALVAAFDMERAKEEITAELATRLKGSPSANPFVILVGGYPGAGKTTLIQALAKSHGINVISFNDMRQALLDRKIKLESVHVARGPSCDWEIIEHVYQRLLKICLENGFNVAIDTNAHAQKLHEVESFLQHDSHGETYRVVKILLNPSIEALFSRVRARVQMQGIHQGTEYDLQRDLALEFKKIDPKDYDLVIDTEKTPFDEELRQVNDFLAPLSLDAPVPRIVISQFKEPPLAS